MAYKVLIPQDIVAEGKEYLLQRGYEIKMGSGIAPEQIAADVEDCAAILARTADFTARVIEAGKKLKVISRYGIGTDNIDVMKATELGIWVTYAGIERQHGCRIHNRLHHCPSPAIYPGRPGNQSGQLGNKK